MVDLQAIVARYHHSIDDAVYVVMVVVVVVGMVVVVFMVVASGIDDQHEGLGNGIMDHIAPT